ncbi:hypothetical protein JOC55_004932 [Paenibacillus sacheonensis]|nr:hypothetical protein [Paenibacillus sacheonensis]
MNGIIEIMPIFRVFQITTLFDADIMLVYGEKTGLERVLT